MRGRRLAVMEAFGNTDIYPGESFGKSRIPFPIRVSPLWSHSSLSCRFEIKPNPFAIPAPGHQGSLSTVITAPGCQSIPRDLTPPAPRDPRESCSTPGMFCPEMSPRQGKVGFYSSWESRVPKGSRGSSPCWFGGISPEPADWKAQICS